MVEVRYKLIPAGFWVRSVALLIDALLFVPVLALAVVSAILLGAENPSRHPSVVTVALLYGFLYPTVMEASSYRATLGKRIMGLRVVSLTGHQISFGQGLGRNFGKIISQVIFSIGFFMAGWTEKKQALHDKMAGTLVMKRIPVYIERSE